MIIINSKLIKNIFIILLLISLTLGFSKSYISYSIDNLDFVLAMGVDVADSDENKLKVTFEFSKSSNYTPESGGSGSDKYKPIINTVEASSIDSAINLMNAHMGKELKLSHCKLLVFSEKLAEKGLSQHIYTLINNVQIRPSTNIIVSKSDTQYYLENLNPTIEDHITVYYEVFPNSGKYTGYTTNATIGDFFYSMSTNTCESFALLAGMSSDQNDEYKDINNIIAGNSPIQSERKAQNLGIAVFKDDRLEGELTALETLSFSILASKVNNFLVSVPNPNNSNDYLDVYLFDDKNTKIKVNIINDTPYVTVDVKLSGEIGTTSYNSDYLNQVTLDEISNYTASYLESIISEFLYKTSKQYHSDISCIGKRALREFTTWTDYENYNWKDRYRDAFFDVNVDVNIKSGSLITQT